MRTFPIELREGRIHAFEITSSWLRMRPLLEVLRSVEGVSEVKRKFFSEDRVTFRFHGHDAVVHEPFGDNSRYWVGLAEPDRSNEVDLRPIHEAFERYNGYTIWGP